MLLSAGEDFSWLGGGRNHLSSAVFRAHFNMEPEYKAIIDQRRMLLVDRINWSKKFSERLRKSAILPRAVLDDIERDANCSNRTYVLLARLVTRPDQTLYQRFCDVLATTGQGQLATILLQDRDNIVWDFDPQQRMRCIEDYANVIHETLLSRLPALDDAHLRAVVADEVRRRVTCLSRFLVDESKEHDHFRCTVLRHLDLEEGDLGVNLVRSDQHKRPYLLFDDALENAVLKNNATVKHLKDYLCAMENSKQSLKATLAQEREMLDATQKKLVEYRKAAEAKDDQAFMYLQKVIMEQDDTIAKLRNRIKGYEEFINLPRGDLIELLSSIRNTCPRANSLHMPRFNEHHLDGSPMTSEVDAGDALRQHIRALVYLCEQQKLRTQQGATKIAELERERGAMKTLLNARGATSLPTALSQHLKSFREQKFELSETIKSVRKRLQEAEKERESLQQKVNELSHTLETDSVFGDSSTREGKTRKVRKKSARGRRNRRISAATTSSADEVREDDRLEHRPAADDPNNNHKIGGKRTEQQTTFERQTLITQFVNMQNSNKHKMVPSS